MLVFVTSSYRNAFTDSSTLLSNLLLVVATKECTKSTVYTVMQQRADLGCGNADMMLSSAAYPKCLLYICYDLQMNFICLVDQYVTGHEVDRATTTTAQMKVHMSHNCNLEKIVSRT